jgi:hypothetical protein
LKQHLRFKFEICCSTAQFFALLTGERWTRVLGWRFRRKKAKRKASLVWLLLSAVCLFPSFDFSRSCYVFMIFWFRHITKHEFVVIVIVINHVSGCVIVIIAAWRRR